MDGWVDRWMDGEGDGLMDECMDGWTGGWMDGDGLMMDDGFMNHAWMHG